MAKNQLVTIDKRMALLPKLEVLVFNENRLQYLPKELQQMPNLHSLYLGKNDLGGLSESELNQIFEVLAAIPTLRKLFLQHNAFTKIPSSITKLTQITHLNISRNNLTEFPAILQEMPHLESIHHSRNFFSLDSIGDNIDIEWLKSVTADDWLDYRCKTYIQPLPK